MKCEDCSFWALSHEDMYGEGFGHCRRMPPVAMVEEGEYVGHGLWPVTAEAQWCGEFRSKHPEAPGAS